MFLSLAQLDGSPQHNLVLTAMRATLHSKELERFMVAGGLRTQIFWLILVGVALQLGCGDASERAASVPEHAFDEWVYSIRYGDDDTLRAELPQELIASLEESAEAWQRVYGEEARLSRFIEAPWLPRPADIESKERLPGATDSLITLRLRTYTGATIDVPMERQGSRWHVRLREAGAPLTSGCGEPPSSDSGPATTEER